jgi:hypothetical protein
MEVSRDMKILKSILGFFKSLFGMGGKEDEDCPDCQEKAVCQTVDRNKKYAVIVGME